MKKKNQFEHVLNNNYVVFIQVLSARENRKRSKCKNYATTMESPREKQQLARNTINLESVHSAKSVFLSLFVLLLPYLLLNAEQQQQRQQQQQKKWHLLHPFGTISKCKQEKISSYKIHFMYTLSFICTVHCIPFYAIRLRKKCALLPTMKNYKLNKSK